MTMRFYPLFLDIRNKPCVIIGGGKVAERKAAGLLKAGARVIVISPDITLQLKRLSQTGKIRHIRRRYRKGDLKGKSLAIAASGSREANRAVFEEAQKLKIPVNTADAPGLSSFIVPSIVDRGPLIVAISTAGLCPALSKKLRMELERKIGKEYASFAKILGAVRTKLLKERVNRDKKDRIIKALVSSDIPALIKRGAVKKIEALVKKVSGSTVFDFGIRLKNRKKE
ncbi:MAG: bifunctional precorrin-2 dehydrogenase/sirohydrochlorin ferrochelatase [Deltaproteobacteria bacterium]|nr:bifunctional precorrin-2 dehydrogenase/sirohydrochlorin ferrochelatase [Deltaproteobacteria bacterium]